jgi:PAS domain-containing protein
VNFLDNNYFAVMDNLNQGILILNANYKITYANMMFSKIVKTESPDLLDRSILAVLPGFNTNYLRNAFSAALHKNYHFFFSAVLQGRNKRDYNR